MNRLPAETESIFDIWKQACQHVVQYTIWLVTCFLGFGLVFLLHAHVNQFMFLRVNPWHLRAYDKWSIYLLGMIWIVGIFLIEGYLRRSQRRARLLAASLTVLSIQILLIAISAIGLDLRNLLLF